MERLTRWIDDQKDIAIESKEATKDECLKKLADYEDGEEQGRLIEFPFGLGDKIYKIEKVFGIESLITAYTVTSLSLDGANGKMWAGIFSGNTINGDFLDLSEFGKTLFRSKAEAEAKIEEMMEEK